MVSTASPTALRARTERPDEIPLSFLALSATPRLFDSHFSLFIAFSVFARERLAFVAQTLSCLFPRLLEARRRHRLRAYDDADNNQPKEKSEMTDQGGSDGFTP
jgi:hypothetical protein